MVFNAAHTNALTDALQAVFLLCYFVHASYHCIKKDPVFSWMIVFVFLTLFFMVLSGAYAHYFYTPAQTQVTVWIDICMLGVMLNYFLMYGMEIPDYCRIFSIALSLFLSYLFLSNLLLTKSSQFIYIAIFMIYGFVSCSYFSKGMLRVGFMLLIISNLLWILIRQSENYILGHSIPVQCRYDNDFYHFCTIISTFVIYKAILKGDWKFPIKSSANGNIM